MKRHTENKQEIIKSLEEKGIHWLANKLYDERKRLAEIKDRCKNVNYTYSVSCERQNEAAADVLHENGITPTILIVEYIANKCVDCPIDYCELFEDKCDMEGKRHVQTVSFYCFDLSDNYLTGIMHDFNTFDNTVLSVKDKHGNVLYQSE